MVCCPSCSGGFCFSHQSWRFHRTRPVWQFSRLPQNSELYQMSPGQLDERVQDSLTAATVSPSSNNMLLLINSSLLHEVRTVFELANLPPACQQRPWIEAQAPARAQREKVEVTLDFWGYYYHWQFKFSVITNINSARLVPNGSFWAKFFR